MQWNVEELVLLKDKLEHQAGNKTYIFECESKLSREEKIAFVDKFQDGQLSKLISLIEKFQSERHTLPCGSWGNVKTVSLKAWIKRNKASYLIDDHYGEVNFLGCRRYLTDESFMTRLCLYDTHSDFVDEIFHRQLNKLLEQENAYFLSHDEYSIKRQQVRDYFTRYNISFNIPYFVTSGNLYKVDANGNEVLFTMEELDDLLDKFHQVDALVESLSN